MTVNIICAPLRPALIDDAGCTRREAGHFRSANNKISWICHICRASPISGIRIAGPIVLALSKGYKRIRHNWPIVIELAY